MAPEDEWQFKSRNQDDAGPAWKATGRLYSE